MRWSRPKNDKEGGGVFFTLFLTFLKILTILEILSLILAFRNVVLGSGRPFKQFGLNKSFSVV